MRRLLPLLVLTVLALPVQAATYDVDVYHSSVEFKVKHLMVANVKGSFKKFSGTFEYDGKDPKSWKAEATIEAASVDTGIESRDKHLRNEDFFDVEKHPTWSFKSTKVEKGAEADTWTLKGKLTMRGVTKDVELKLERGGVMIDEKGKEHVGFTAKGKINRKDFGIAYNKELKSGGVAIGEMVELTIEVEGIQK